MTTWTTDELDALGTAREIAIAPLKTNGSYRQPTTIWIVRIDDALYVRSYNGPHGNWYQTARTSGAARISSDGAEHEVTLEPAAIEPGRVDEAYHAKYERSPYVEAMTTTDTATTTLRLLPDHRN